MRTGDCSCPHCGSHAVYKVRRESAWGDCAEMHPLNPETEDNYPEGLRSDVPDTQVYFCDNCSEFYL